MGSFLSSFLSGPPAAAEDDSGVESSVIAIHSKDRWDEQWQSHKNSNKLMVIDFSATWCGPCRFIEPVFKALSTKFSESVFLKIDVDELSEVSRMWKVEAMPTFVLIKGGQEVSRIVGAKKEELERKIHMFSS